MSKKINSQVLSILRELGPVKSEAKQRSLLQKLINPNKKKPFKFTSNNSIQLEKQFIKQNKDYLSNKYSNKLKNGSIFILSKNLNRGFDNINSDIDSINIENSIFQKLIQVQLSKNHYKLLTFQTTSDFLNKLDEISHNEYEEISSILINTLKVPIEDLNQNDEMNYESLLRQSQANRDPIEKLLSRISSLGLLKVLIKDNYVVLTK